MTCPFSKFEARKHLTTGEAVYQYVDSDPTGVPDRDSLKISGRPLRTFVVCADRVEVTESWSFSSGHAEWYEDGRRDVFDRDDPETQAELARRFGDSIANDIDHAFALLG